MPRFLAFACILLIGTCGVLLAENRLVRKDQAMMLQAYEGFLNKKAGGKRLADHIKPSSLAIFKSEAGFVGCALIK